jgi:hypothetical protein
MIEPYAQSDEISCYSTDKIDQIIIITTAISRIDIHNLSFPTYKTFLENNYTVKWFINIDKPPYCKDTVADTEENLRKLLSDYELYIFTSNKPNFFNAVKTLLAASKVHMTENTCLLWLEDDWILNKKCTIKYFIDNFLFPHSFINMVYNKLGSFPPFIMGNKLANIFYTEFLKYNTPYKNPETINRHIMRSLVKKIGIVYYDYIEDLATLSQIKNPLVAGLVYEEAYLKIGDCRILTKNPSEKYDHCFDNNIILPIDDMQAYIKQDKSKLIFLRFGTIYTNHHYKNSFFKDIGRAWLRNIAQ